MKQTILKFGLLAVLLMFLVEIGKLSAFTGSHYKEFLIIISAIALIAFGFLLRNIITTRDKVLKGNFIPENEKLKMLQISEREFEVLQNIAQGYSNSQIAERLFVSESTIKSHVSSLLFKLNAKRRTEAIKQAKEYGLL